MTYDNAGNLIYDSYTGEGTRTYDAENRMTTAWANSQWQTYTYDGGGHRVRRNVNGTETWQVYGIAGELLAEYAANNDPSNPQKEYGYRNGQLLVTAEPSANIHWLITDQLGTPRMIFDNSGSLSGMSRHDFLPFGEESYAGTNGRTAELGYTGYSVRQKFTGYESDGETQLNFAQARYQSPVQGRFTSADPSGASMTVANPQSFNRYAYVLNSPTNLTDPSGMVNSHGDSRYPWEEDPFGDIPWGVEGATAATEVPTASADLEQQFLDAFSDPPAEIAPQDTVTAKEYTLSHTAVSDLVRANNLNCTLD